MSARISLIILATLVFPAAAFSAGKIRVPDKATIGRTGVKRLVIDAGRGVKQAAFYVLRGTYAPGILVEMGFMTNPVDQKKLNDKKVRVKIAKAIHRGVLKYAQLKGWKRI